MYEKAIGALFDCWTSYRPVLRPNNCFCCYYSIRVAGAKSVPATRIVRGPSVPSRSAFFFPAPLLKSTCYRQASLRTVSNSHLFHLSCLPCSAAVATPECYTLSCMIFPYASAFPMSATRSPVTVSPMANLFSQVRLPVRATVSTLLFQCKSTETLSTRLSKLYRIAPTELYFLKHVRHCPNLQTLHDPPSH